MKRTWIIWFVLALGTTIGCSLLGKAGQNTPTPAPAAATTSAATVLFQDDFSNPDSGWDRVNVKDGITDYTPEGAYRILLNLPNTDVWANPGLSFTDVRIEVDATKVGGPDNNDFGVQCRYQDDNNFYFFLISSDGYYGIGKVKDGEQTLLSGENMEYSDAILQGRSTNHLRADCVGPHLKLYVNGVPVATAEDSDFTHGDVGLMAGTFDESGTDVLFDNFIVLQP